MVLSAVHPFTRCFKLVENGITIGTIRLNHVFTRNCFIDLPGVSLSVQVFIFWVAVLMWRRAANSNN